MELSLNEIAGYLNLAPSTVDRWIRQGRIPVWKKGSACAFSKKVLVKWAREHNLSFSPPQENNSINDKDKPLNLVYVMKNGGVLYNIAGDDPEAVFKNAVYRIQVFQAQEKDKLYYKLVERESISSTGVGKGVAIPHPRSQMPEIVKSALITTCFLEKPIDFKAVDDKPVFVLFILLCPSLKLHLHLLSRLSFYLRDDGFIAFLRSVPDAGEMLAKVTSLEKNMDRSKNLLSG